MNNKGMFYTNVSDYETKEDMMNDFIALRMYDIAKDKEIERLNSIIKEAIEHLSIKQIRFINEKDYVLNDEDLDEIMKILEGTDKE